MRAIYDGLRQFAGTRSDITDFLIHSVILEDPLLIFDQINNTLVVGFKSDRLLHQYCVQAEFALHFLHNPYRVGPRPVQFVDETHPGQLVTVHLLGDSECLCLDAGCAADEQYRAI